MPGLWIPTNELPPTGGRICRRDSASDVRFVSNMTDGGGQRTLHFCPPPHGFETFPKGRPASSDFDRARRLARTPLPILRLRTDLHPLHRRRRRPSGALGHVRVPPLRNGVRVSAAHAPASAFGMSQLRRPLWVECPACQRIAAMLNVSLSRRRDNHYECEDCGHLWTAPDPNEGARRLRRAALPARQRTS